MQAGLKSQYQYHDCSEYRSLECSHPVMESQLGQHQYYHIEQSQQVVHLATRSENDDTQGGSSQFICRQLYSQLVADQLEHQQIESDPSNQHAYQTHLEQQKIDQQEERRLQMYPFAVPHHEIQPLTNLSYNTETRVQNELHPNVSSGNRTAPSYLPSADSDSRSMQESTGSSLNLYEYSLQRQYAESDASNNPANNEKPNENDIYNQHHHYQYQHQHHQQQQQVSHGCEQQSSAYQAPGIYYEANNFGQDPCPSLDVAQISSVPIGENSLQHVASQPLQQSTVLPVNLVNFVTEQQMRDGIYSLPYQANQASTATGEHFRIQAGQSTIENPEQHSQLPNPFLLTGQVVGSSNQSLQQHSEPQVYLPLEAQTHQLSDVAISIPQQANDRLEQQEERANSRSDQQLGDCSMPQVDKATCYQDSVNNLTTLGARFDGDPSLPNNEYKDNESEHSSAASVISSSGESSSSSSSSPTMTRDERKAREAKIPLSYHEIVNLSIDQFNEHLAKHNLTESQLSLIKDIRRRGKNKVAAQSCRKRKMEQIYELQHEVNQLTTKRRALNHEKNQLVKEHTSLIQRFDRINEIIQTRLQIIGGDLNLWSESV